MWAFLGVFRCDWGYKLAGSLKEVIFKNEWPESWKSFDIRKQWFYIIVELATQRKEKVNLGSKDVSNLNELELILFL